MHNYIMTISMLSSAVWCIDSLMPLCIYINMCHKKRITIGLNPGELTDNSHKSRYTDIKSDGLRILARIIATKHIKNSTPIINDNEMNSSLTKQRNKK